MGSLSYHSRVGEKEASLQPVTQIHNGHFRTTFIAKRNYSACSIHLAGREKRGLGTPNMNEQHKKRLNPAGSKPHCKGSRCLPFHPEQVKIQAPVECWEDKKLSSVRGR